MKNRKLITMLILALIFVMLIPAQTMAVGLIDIDRDIDFTVEYLCEGTPVVGATFDIYKVADADAYEHMTMRSEFAAYPIDFENIDQDGWNAYAVTLKGYVQYNSDTYTPLASAQTDNRGKARFNMKAGLYLVIGSPFENENEETYTCDPFMVFLPQVDSETGDWSYNVTARPKNTVYVTGCKVLKIWNDIGYSNMRPEKVTVRLLCDGVEYDVQELSAANNWRYDWDELEGGHEWSVIEDAVLNYTPIIQQQGITFTITNLYHPGPDTSPHPGETPVPTPTPTRTPNPDEPLPQTGLLWWPVPVLLVAGLVVFLLGVSRRRA